MKKSHLSIAAVVGLLGQGFGARAQAVESVGAWISLAILVLVAVLNIVQLKSSGESSGGYRARLLPKALRTNSHVLAALPVGLLFGLGFETSSQLATYALAFTSGKTFLGATAIGSAFCAGIICTDTLDSMLVHRFLTRSSEAMRSAKRTWLISVTAFALLVAAYQGAQMLGWRAPFNELTLSSALMLALFGIYACIVAQPRAPLAAQHSSISITHEQERY